MLRRLARPILGSALALFIGELAIRQVYTLSLEYEPGYGYVTAANSVVRWRREGRGTSRWTRHGVRRAVPVASDEPRVLAVGDSFTEALMLDDGLTYADLLEQRLAGVQVVNAGRSTASAADYVAFADRHARLFSPIWTIVQLRDDDLTADAFDAAGTHFEPCAEDALCVRVNIAPERTSTTWQVRQLSMLAGYAAVRFGELREAAAEEPPLFSATRMPATPPLPSNDDSYPIEKEVDALVAAYAGRITLLLMSTFDGRSPERPSSVEARILARCQARELSCVTPRAAYTALARHGDAPYGFSNTGYNTGHMNAAGHAACAEALAAELVRKGVVRGRAR